MINLSLHRKLAILGAIPFVYCAISVLFGINFIEKISDPILLVNSYSLGIVCFLTGIHWATYLYKDSSRSMNLMILSNIFFLLAWLTFLILDEDIALISYQFLLIFLLLIDLRLFNLSIINKDYFETRILATSLAVLSLLVVVFS